MSADDDRTSLYRALQLERHASHDEIKTAYRRLSQIYHPDKHLDEQRKLVATEQFTKMKDAYEILSDPLKRRVYDEYGMEGVQAMQAQGLELTKFEDIRAQFERAGGAGRSAGHHNQAQDRDALFQIKNSLRTSVDGRGLVELLHNLAHSDDDEYAMFFSPLIVTQTTLGADASIYLTNKDSVRLQGSFVSKNGKGGSGPLTVTARRQFSSRSFMESSLFFRPSKKGLGIPQVLALKLWRGISERSSLMLEASTNLLQSHSTMAITCSRQLTSLTVGQLSWTASHAGDDCSGGVICAFRRMGGDLEDDLSIDRQSPWYRRVVAWLLSLAYPCAYQMTWSVGEADTGVSASIKRGIGRGVYRLGENDGAHWKLRGRFGLDGWLVELGGGRSYVHHNMSWGLALACSNEGIHVRFKADRAGHRVVVPVLIADTPLPTVAVASLSVLIATVVSIQLFVARPLKKRATQRRKQHEFELRSEDILAARKQARDSVVLMSETVRACREREEQVPGGGLLIIKAFYGAEHKLARCKADGVIPENQEIDFGYIDVTDALQSRVENSQLHLFASSKSTLTGFWDPTLLEEEEIALRIWYRFQNELHCCTVSDYDAVDLPLRDHRL
ncbi:DnaJ-like subfamily C member 11 [Porphyridium purpureum]|uniref:DnaJ-like subfamily C member 11 n=1 Tax=Porphyridium purpureum TaxID=35688 RepID=A0A5J4YWD4_PORPP|nr:DnaJ-like subfamily C member 11 [Porphyridium purpureum]|eukprot:POR0982..scf209_3